MNRIAVTVEDVIAQPDAERVVAALPKAEGLMLLRALAQTYTILYLTTYEDTEGVREWLSRQAAPEGAKVLGHPDRHEQLAKLRAGGNHVEFLITGTPSTLISAHELGIPTLCFVIPPPELRWAQPKPQPPTAWGTVLTNLQAQSVPLGGEEDGTRTI